MENLGHELAVFSKDFLLNRKITKKVTESHILYLAVSKINPHIPLAKAYNAEFIEIKVTSEEVLEVLEKTSNARKYNIFLGDIAEGMAGMFIRDPTEHNSILPIFSKICYSKYDGLRVLFNPIMTPFLLELSKTTYTNMLLRDVCKLKSDYSIRLLEIVTMYVHENNGCKLIEKTYSMDEFKNLMQVPDTYFVRFSNFKKQILDKAVNDINAIGNYSISYELIKKGLGAKVIALKFVVSLPDAVFKFNKKVLQAPAQTQQPAETSAPVPPTPSPMSVSKSKSDPPVVPRAAAEADERLVERLKALGVLKSFSRKWLKQDRDRFLWALRLTEFMYRQGRLKNFGGYLNNRLQDDGAYEYHLEQERIKVERAQRAVEREEAQRRQDEEERRRWAEELDITKKSVDELKQSLKFYYARKTHAQENGMEPDNIIFININKNIKELEDEIAKRHSQIQKEADYSDVPMPDDYDYIESEVLDDMPVPEEI